MHSKRNIIDFNIPYSLPCNTHSSSLATRRVTRGSEQQLSKYTPDYGGVLEIPGSNIKQSGIGRDLPFFPGPHHVRITTSNKEYDKESTSTKVSNPSLGPDCLIVTNLYKSRNDDSFTTIRALDKNLYFDTFSRIIIDERPRSHSVQTLESKIFVHIPYANRITGLKYNNFAKDIIIVKFNKGIKLLRLNESFELPSPRNDSANEAVARCSDQAAFDFLGSFPSHHPMSAIDGCLNTARNILGIAFSDNRGVDIKLYDLMRSQRCYRRVQEQMQDDRSMSRSFATSIKSDRKRSLRSFVPSKSTYETVRQLENDPSHMLNMLLTTTNRVALIDPRSNSIGHLYADRYKMLAVLPMERFNKIEFSLKNPDQFYLLSNVKLRAFDKRFLSQPMNSLEHMLDITDIDGINMKVINLESSSLETICMSANGQLGFISFDQSQLPIDENIGPLVNPKSVHAPLIDPIPARLGKKTPDELSGLSVSTDSIFEDENIVFSIAQLKRDGDLWVRAYQQPQEAESNCEPPIRTVMRDIQIHGSNSDDEPHECRADLRERGIGSKDDCEQLEFIDVLDNISIVEAKEKLTSKRALEKYSQMKAKLQRSK